MNDIPETVGYIFKEEAKIVSPSDTKDVEQEKTLSFGEYSLSIDEVYRDIKRLTLSRNPLDLVFKTNEIREKFAFFINSLANFISQSFSSFDNDSFINELYHDSRYHHVWMDLASSFLRDAHYCSEKFDTIGYLKKNSDGFFQEYTVNKSDLLGRFDKGIMNDDDFIAVKTLIQILIEIYRKAKHLEARWEKQEIICKKDTTFEQRTFHTIFRERTIHARNKVTELIQHFTYEKESFREELEKIFESFNLSIQDREDLRMFAFKEIIDLHYPDIQYIFFDTSLPFIKDEKKHKGKQFLTKRDWLRLK